MKRFASLSTLALLVLGLSAFRGAPDDAARKIVIESVGNELKFAQTEFIVKASQEVHLVFVNKATVQGMSHNVVILTDEASIGRVGVATIQAAELRHAPGQSPA